MTQAEPSAELAAAFAAHAKAHGLKPGQQVNVLLLFVTVQTLFPEISLQQFLSRLPAYYQANDDNRLFPKTALDHHCPTAGSACPPAKRISYLLEYLAYVSRARLGNETVVSLDAFLTFVLSTEVPVPPPTPEVAPPTHVQTAAPTPAVPPTAAPTLAVPPTPLTSTEPVPGAPAVVVTDAAVPGPIPPSAPQVPTPTPEPTPVAAVGQVFEVTLSLKAQDHRQIEGYLTTPGRLGTVAAGDTLVSNSVDYGPATLHVDIVNSDPQPYIDIYARAKDAQTTIIADLPPIEGRSSVLGEYTVRAKDGSFTILLKVT